MRTRTSALTFAVVLVAVGVCFGGEDMNMGTWKLNEAKSQIGPGTPKIRPLCARLLVTI